MIQTPLSLIHELRSRLDDPQFRDTPTATELREALEQLLRSLSAVVFYSGFDHSPGSQTLSVSATTAPARVTGLRQLGNGVSSVYLPAGMALLAFESDDFSGAAWYHEESLMRLPTEENNRWASAIVFPAIFAPQLYSEPNFAGVQVQLFPGLYSREDLAAFGGRPIGSIRVPSQWHVRLWSPRGAQLFDKTTGPVDIPAMWTFADGVSSVEVMRGDDLYGGTRPILFARDLPGPGDSLGPFIQVGPAIEVPDEGLVAEGGFLPVVPRTALVPLGWELVLEDQLGATATLRSVEATRQALPDGFVLGGLRRVTPRRVA